MHIQDFAPAGSTLGPKIYRHQLPKEQSGSNPDDTRSGGSSTAGIPPRFIKVFSSGTDNYTVLNETMHEIGLSDRYDEYQRPPFTNGRSTTYPDPHVGFRNDIMSTIGSTILNDALYDFLQKQQ